MSFGAAGAATTAAGRSPRGTVISLDRLAGASSSWTKPPGTQWIYGTSVDWLGRLVERLSGKNLEEYFRERIFTPLGMPDTFYNVPDGKQPRLVTVHQRQGGRADAPLTELPNQPQGRRRRSTAAADSRRRRTTTCASNG